MKPGRSFPCLLSMLVIAAATVLAQQPAGEIENPRPGAAQPVPYSHKTHLRLGLKCGDCHTNPDPGQNMGLPESGKCMTCHRTIAHDRPDVQKIAGFLKENRLIPWIRVYTISPAITWSHRNHLKAGLACNMCHGDVAKLDVMTKLMNVTTMDGCVGCHKDNQADTSCGVCHEGK